MRGGFRRRAPFGLVAAASTLLLSVGGCTVGVDFEASDDLSILEDSAGDTTVTPDGDDGDSSADVDDTGGDTGGDGSDSDTIEPDGEDCADVTAPCNAAGAACVDDDLVVCADRGDGCLVETTTACADGAGGFCDDTGATAVCSGDPCFGLTLCAAEGVSCDGETLVSCMQNTDGCLVETRTACAELGGFCDAAGAQCLYPALGEPTFMGFSAGFVPTALAADEFGVVALQPLGEPPGDMLWMAYAEYAASDPVATMELATPIAFDMSTLSGPIQPLLTEFAVIVPHPSGTLLIDRRNPDQQGTTVAALGGTVFSRSGTTYVALLEPTGTTMNLVIGSARAEGGSACTGCNSFGSGCFCVLSRSSTVFGTVPPQVGMDLHAVPRFGEGTPYRLPFVAVPLMVADPVFQPTSIEVPSFMNPGNIAGWQLQTGDLPVDWSAIHPDGVLITGAPGSDQVELWTLPFTDSARAGLLSAAALLDTAEVTLQEHPMLLTVGPDAPGSVARIAVSPTHDALSLSPVANTLTMSEAFSLLAARPIDADTAELFAYEAGSMSLHRFVVSLAP